MNCCLLGRMMVELSAHTYTEIVILVLYASALLLFVIYSQLNILHYERLFPLFLLVQLHIFKKRDSIALCIVVVIVQLLSLKTHCR